MNNVGFVIRVGKSEKPHDVATPPRRSSTYSSAHYSQYLADSMVSPAQPAKVFKILTPEQWRDWTTKGTFSGAGIDIKDGYIHLSTQDQVVETYEKFFAGADVVLVTIDLSKVTSEVKWEPSRNNALFPHVYGELATDAVIDHQESWDGSKPSI